MCSWFPISISSHPPMTSDLQAGKLAQARMSDFLRKRCSFLTAHPTLCQSTKVAKSFPLVDLSLGSGWDRGKDPRPQQPEEVWFTVGHGSGDLPEDQPRTFLYSQASPPAYSPPPGSLSSCICSPSSCTPPKAFLKYSDMCDIVQVPYKSTDL